MTIEMLSLETSVIGCSPSEVDMMPYGGGGWGGGRWVKVSNEAVDALLAVVAVFVVVVEVVCCWKVDVAVCVR